MVDDLASTLSLRALQDDEVIAAFSQGLNDLQASVEETRENLENIQLTPGPQVTRIYFL